MEHEFIRFKWGIGRLVAESKNMPIVIPMWHVGMDKVLPNVLPYRLKTGNYVVVNFGNPINLDQILKNAQNMKADEETTRKMITNKIQEERMILKHQTEKLFNELKSCLKKCKPVCYNCFLSVNV